LEAAQAQRLVIDLPVVYAKGTGQCFLIGLCRTAAETLVLSSFRQKTSRLGFWTGGEMAWRGFSLSGELGAKRSFSMTRALDSATGSGVGQGDQSDFSEVKVDALALAELGKQSLSLQ
jgi:hypothetical protein